MANNEYTEKQLKIISGEIPIETVNGCVLRWLYPKALANNDEELTKRIKKRMDALKAISAQKNRQRTRIRNAKIKRNEVIQWKQPRSNGYTEHQKQIVRGEIPYEQVHTNELISIHLKAHNNRDYELSERILSLITARRMDAVERERQQHKNYNKKHSKARSISQRNNSFIGTDVDLPLTHFDKAALLGDEDLDEYSEERLRKALDTLKKQGNEEVFAVIESLFLYKKDPSAFYVVKDHEKAIDLIEELLDLPIRRPETWFYEEDKLEVDG